MLLQRTCQALQVQLLSPPARLRLCLCLAKQRCGLRLLRPRFWGNFVHDRVFSPFSESKFRYELEEMGKYSVAQLMALNSWLTKIQTNLSRLRLEV